MKHTKGQVIVEVLVAFGLATILLPVILTGFATSSSGKVQQEQRLKAQAYAQEAAEAVRNIREQDWQLISTNGTYHPKISSDCITVTGSTWKLCSGSETIEDFTRTITISDADPVDASVKKIDIDVTWNNIITSSVNESFYLTRWKNITSSLSVSGTLLNQGSGDWCAPTLNLGSLDLPKNGVANAISAFQFGSGDIQIAAVTGDNASGVSYANVLATDPASPATPSAAIEGTFDGYKTNDVFTEENYAYLATDTNTKEVEIIDLNNLSGGKYAEAGYFNAPGNGNAASAATSGNVGYMVGGTKLYNFDLSSKTGSRNIIDADGTNLPGTGTKMIVSGTRAYITTNSTSAQLVVADISNTSALSVIKTFSLPAQGGKALYLNSTGTRAYVATGQSATQREVFILNIDESTPNWSAASSSSLTLGTYETNGMDPKGVVLVNISNYLIVAGTGGSYQYQVVDVSNENSPSLCTRGGATSGQLSIPSGVNGIVTVFTAAQRAYSYIITGDATSELKIIEGGPGGSGSGGGLTLTSDALDAGHTSIFNRFSVSDLTPSGITATYKVAVSTDCTAYNFTGNYTSAGGSIPMNINPGRCFKFQVTFSGGAGPVGTTVDVNYSP